MTAIGGIVNLDGAAIPRDDLDLMMKALAHHGLDRVQLLGATFASHSELVLAPDPQYPPLSTHNKSNNDLAIVLNARLDNRTDLFHQLGIAESEQDDYADSALILTAYEKWGERCSEFLLGDFVFAVWDRHNRRLFCSRDHMGLCSLFYYCDARRLIFASEPKAIVAVSGVTKKVNRNKLATLAFPAARPIFWDQSWFEDINPLPAGTSLTVDERGIRKHKYWEPPFATKLPYKTDEKILEAFQDLMFEVVGARLRGSSPITALLSGGLDSSAVVSVAARVLEHRNKELHTLSAVLPEANDPWLTDERNFINQFRDWPNVTINYVTAPACGPFDNVEELVWSCDSPSITSRHYLYSAFAEAARERGARLMLDGSGGELGPSFHGEGYYAELLLQFRWHKLCREMSLRKRVSGDQLWRTFRSDVMHPLIPISLLDRLRPKPVEDLTFDRQQPLQTRFAESQLAGFLPKVKVSSRSAVRVLPNHARVQHQRMCTVQQKATPLAFVGHPQVEIRYPFMDKRLLEFCLAVPGDLKVRNGYKRNLIRSGLDKTLPPAIQWRSDKKPFSPDYLRRYNSQRKQVQTLLEDIGSNDPVRTVVDVEKLRELAALPVADNEHGTFAESVARDGVPIGVYLIYFLRRFEEFRN